MELYKDLLRQGCWRMCRRWRTRIAKCKPALGVSAGGIEQQQAGGRERRGQERGCVANQPQRMEESGAPDLRRKLRLVEDDTAALHAMVSGKLCCDGWGFVRKAL